jgi:Polyketide cyclase / dehydrase and lipid transport/Protein of unknown function (DUF2934)
MGATTHSIEVNAPLRAVYNQWTQFEEFPRFMEGVDEVRQEGPKSLFWKTKMGGKDKQWETEITEQVPDKRIAWESVDGTPNRGEVTFESLDFERTRITLTMEYEPEGFFAKAGDALGIPSGRVEGDLKRFRDFIEERGMETGGWRGQIEEGESSDSTAKAVRQEGALSVEEANERTVRAQGREIPRESAVIEEIARGKGGIGTDRIEAEGGESFQAAEHPSELAEEPSGLATELLGAQGKPQFDRAKAGVAAPTQEEIARRAYELYIERGQAPGNEREDWLEAEKELSERYGNDSPRTSA